MSTTDHSHRPANTARPIAFNRPAIVGSELQEVVGAIEAGNISTGGDYTKACERFLVDTIGAEAAMLVTSCTAALEMAAILCDLAPGDEVIMPSYTFVSTASAVVRAGATPVFVDIRPDTFNIDETLIEGAITTRTKAISPIHYAGVSAEMDTIVKVADKHDLIVIEDAAQGIGARYRDSPLGGIGQLSTISFHETKNIICGEGGALCINDPALVERALILRNKGTNRQAFLAGQADKYTWVDVGSSFAMSELLAAFLYGQFAEMAATLGHRSDLWWRYHQTIQPLAAAHGFEVPSIPSHCEPNHHIFPILTRSADERGQLIAWLQARHIQAVFHYVPLHSSPMGARVGRTHGDMDTTDRVASTLVRLPLHHAMTIGDADRVAEAIAEFYESMDRS